VRNRATDPQSLLRVLGVFERNYNLSSADFYRAHVRDEAPASDLVPWHRETWSGTYRQWLDDQEIDDSWRDREVAHSASVDERAARI
jgi:hypothetical protein